MAKATMESKRIKKVGKLKERAAKIAKKKEDASLEIETPYPGKTKRRYRRSSKIQRVVTNLKRLIRNHATP